MPDIIRTHIFLTSQQTAHIFKSITKKKKKNKTQKKKSLGSILNDPNQIGQSKHPLQH
jgi:archaellum component FlaG (FlaF/FlaG flagellin family)